MSNTSPPFLEVLVHRSNAAYDPVTGLHVVGMSGLCAGYELGSWRCEQLAQHLIDVWLPDFALKYSELTDVGPRTMGTLMRRAARAVYQTKKFKRRGEFGELLLHAILMQEFHTMPAVSKLYYKDTPNATVHGFDGVHVVEAADGLELWFGEAKFYNDAARAVRAAVKSLEQHRDRDYLRNEFAAIIHKIDDAWPHAADLKRLLDPNTTLDTVFRRACLPVLITYDSDALAVHQTTDAQYRAAVAAEWDVAFADFSGRKLPPRFKVHLILVPLATKKSLISALDRELRRLQ